MPAFSDIGLSPSARQAPNVLESAPVFFARCSLVEKNRNAQRIPEASAERSRQLRAFADRYATNGHKRSHVDSAHARVHAGVFRQIDSLNSDAGSRECSFHYRRGIAGECENAAVVVRVTGGIEQPRASNVRNGASNRSDDHRIAAL
jgi:hypothetical protein